MNTNVQVRIWANYKDFAEATVKVPLRILPIEYGEMFSPDRYRNIPCADYHSFLYTPDSICINYHTLVPPTQKLRDQRIVISLAVRRGCRLQQNPAEVLSAIRRDFISYINDKSIFFDADNVNGIEDKIISQVEAWEEAIQTVKEDEQILVNRGTEINGTAFVSYVNSEIFDAYIQKPARPEYKGKRLVFIVSNENKSAFLDYGLSELNVSPVYEPSYQVYLTAYSTTNPIATIYSLSDPIDVCKEKKYHKPLALKGSLKDNWAQWKVTRSADGESYNLGVVFEAESKIYKLDFNKLSSPFEKFQFAWGTLDKSSMTLIVVGDELARAINNSLIVTRTDQYSVQSVSCQNDTIYVAWNELFQYSTDMLRKYIHDQYQFEPLVTITYKNSKQSERQWWEGRKEDYKIIIADESGKYMKSECTMDTPIHQIKLEKKSGIKIKFFWGDGREVDRGNPILFVKDNIQQKAEVLGDSVEFFQEGEYSISLQGYEVDPKTIRVRKEMEGAIRYLRVLPTFGTKIKANIIPIVIFLVLIFVSFVGGYFFRVKYPNLPPQQEPIAIDSTILQQPTVQEYVQKQLKIQQLKHESEIKGYKATIENLEEKIAENDRDAASKLARAMAKLETIDFTTEDVQKAKGLVGNDVAKKRICEACEKALNHIGDKRKTVDNLKTFLNSEIGKKLPELPRRELQKITNDTKYGQAYESSERVGSIRKQMEEIYAALGQ